LSVASVITLGYGSFSTVNFVPTLGYGSSSTPIPPLVTPAPWGPIPDGGGAYGWNNHPGIRATERNRKRQRQDEEEVMIVIQAFLAMIGDRNRRH
jgi:hypothetical protein